MLMHRSIYYNGSLYAENTGPVSAFSRAVHYGDGVFETMRARGASIFRLSDHLNRLCCGLELLRIPLPDRAQLTAAAQEVLQANAFDETIIKIIAFRDGQPGPTPAPTRAPGVLITAERCDPERLRRCAAGISARIVCLRRDETSPLSSIKSLNYLTNILARMEAADHGDVEALMLNRQGRVAEGATSNVFAVRHGSLITPALSAGALDGITRGVLFEIAQTLALPCAEADITPDELQCADEVFLSNAGSGVMPLIMLDGRAVGTGKPGAVTLRCQTAYNEFFIRETEPPA